MIVKSIAVAFSMYSKIPMPRVEWNEKNVENRQWIPEKGLGVSSSQAPSF